MIQLDLALGARSYPILIAPGLLARAGEVLRLKLSKKAVIVTNPTVASLYLSTLRNSLLPGTSVETILVPDGEAHKSEQTLSTIYTRLLELGADRRTTLLALGGGVIGDLTGYAAATYQRGIPFVQLPTTLLSQVDSSVGGKTGINHPLGKNMIGAFHQPRAVLIDTESLRSLPPRELATGLAEVIKYGLIRDAEFFCWIEANLDRLLALHPDALGHAIRRSCEIKAQIVATDEIESGERAILNFGHTFGHAIEAGMGYGVWTHGEAVAAGMVMATRLSEDMTQLAPEVRNRLELLLRRAALPTEPPALEVDAFLQSMTHDKKTLEGQLRLILLETLGKACINESMSAGAVREFLRREPGLIGKAVH